MARIKHTFLILISSGFLVSIASFLPINSDIIKSSVNAQVKDKEYVPIIEGAKEGALPRISVEVLKFDDTGKEGEIPLEIIPQGFWKYEKTLARAKYDVFEFTIELPSSTIEVGEPNVPIKVIEVDIPPNAEIDEISLEPELLKTVEQVTLLPNQEPLPISKEQLIFEKEKFTIDEQLYKQEAAYPGTFFEVVTTGYYGERKIAIIKVFPVQYYPASKKVEFYKLTGSIKFKAEEIPLASEEREVLSDSQKAVGLSVSNIGDVQKWKGYDREIGSDLIREFEEMEFYRQLAKEKALLTIPCIIISADLFYCPAKDLATHYTNNKGIRTVVVRERLIQRGISGKDAPDKIRNYIKLLHKYCKTKWIVLFGDVGKDSCGVMTVPTRMAVDPSPYAGVDDGWIPCDYYYACLDGTWDANNNGKYGELADKPDLLPEVCIGRIPTNNLDAAIKYVSTVINYAKTPPKVRGALLAGNDLGWGCHEITFKEGTIRPLIQKCPFSTVTRLYQKWNNLSATTFAKVVNAGIDFIEYYGHGSPASTQLMSMGQVDSLLKKTSSFPVVFALSCSTARYDNQECFGEAWVEGLKASSYIGSVRVAYGSASTGEGLDIRFLKNYCKLRKTGCALDLAKYDLFKSYGWNATTLKTILEFTLFGDPIMVHVK